MPRDLTPLQRRMLLADVRPPVGPVIPGNMDLLNRPKIPHQGGTATVFSGSYNLGDKLETLLPHVALGIPRTLSTDEAIARYLATGEHLGKFGTPMAATNAGEFIHQGQAALGRVGK